MNLPRTNTGEITAMSTELARPIIFGEVLFDCLPDGVDVLGGAPFNVAWNLHALGMNPILVTRIGEDARGQKVLDAMNAQGMDLQGLQVDLSHETGQVNVRLNNGEPTYDIVNNVAYDHIELNDLPSIQDAGLLYHGSLSLRNNQSSSAFKHLYKRLNVPVFLDVNLRFPWYNISNVRELMKQATWCKLNKYELEVLNSNLSLNPNSPVSTSIFSRNLETIYLTQGEAGAASFAKDGTQYTVAPDKATQVVDLIGAGDAFSSILIMGLLIKWDMETTLERAQSFASKTVGIQGAVCTDMNFYRPFKEAWQS